MQIVLISHHTAVSACTLINGLIPARDKVMMTTNEEGYDTVTILFKFSARHKMGLYIYMWKMICIIHSHFIVCLYCSL